MPPDSERVKQYCAPQIKSVGAMGGTFYSWGWSWSQLHVYPSIVQDCSRRVPDYNEEGFASRTVVHDMFKWFGSKYCVDLVNTSPHFHLYMADLSTHAVTSCNLQNIG